MLYNITLRFSSTVPLLKVSSSCIVKKYYVERWGLQASVRKREKQPTVGILTILFGYKSGMYLPKKHIWRAQKLLPYPKMSHSYSGSTYHKIKSNIEGKLVNFLIECHSITLPVQLSYISKLSHHGPP